MSDTEARLEADALDSPPDRRAVESIAESADAPVAEVGDEPVSATAEPPLEAPLLVPRWARFAIVAAVSLVALRFWAGFQIEGHNGGDDFALYINQGRSLLHGDVGDTLAKTHFTVENSAWQTFSPYAYPWGFPLMLAAVMAFTGTVDTTAGIDYAPLKLLVSVCFLVGLLAYAAMLRRRVSVGGSALLPLFFATNFLYVLHTDNILSELPFLMSLMLFVVALDRAREHDRLLGPALLPLVGLGLLACFAFNIRREGLGVLAGLALAQAVALWRVAGAGDRGERIARVRALDWRPAAAPWATFFLSTVLLQLMLPSDIAPRFVERDPTATAGLHRITDNLRIYEPLLAEQLGLKDIGPNETLAFGSTALGAAVFWSVLGFAVLGVVLTTIRHGARDLPVAGVFVGVAFFVMIAPFQTYRYIMALVPFLLYFAYQGIAIPLRALGGRHGARVALVADVCVIAFVLGGWPDTSNARDYRTAWVGPQAGPQEPATLEMYRAVRDETRGDDVIVANRARLMTLYTGRASVQGGAIDFIDGAGDYYVMYLEPDGSPGTYTQYPLTDAEAAERGFVEVWRNSGWVLWRIPPVGAGP